MAPPYRERRKYLRRPVLLNCRIEGTAVEGPLHLTDLSESGCFIATSHPLPRDSQITLFVTLAGDEIKITGRVVRVEPGRGVGVEINVNLLSQYARLALEDFLRQPAGCASDDGRPADPLSPMPALPTRTGVVCPSCYRPVGVKENKALSQTLFWCPTCNHRWTAETPGRTPY